MSDRETLRELLLQQDGSSDPGVASEWWPGALLVLLIFSGWAVRRHRRRRHAGRTNESPERLGKDS